MESLTDPLEDVLYKLSLWLASASSHAACFSGFVIDAASLGSSKLIFALHPSSLVRFSVYYSYISGSFILFVLCSCVGIPNALDSRVMS